MYKECSGKSTGDQTTIEFAHWVEDARKKVDAISAGDARGGGRVGDKDGDKSRKLYAVPNK